MSEVSLMTRARSLLMKGQTMSGKNKAVRKTYLNAMSLLPHKPPARYMYGRNVKVKSQTKSAVACRAARRKKVAFQGFSVRDRGGLS